MYQSWAEMEKLVDDGLVRHIGVSNFNIQLLLDMLTYAKIKPVCNQIELHPYNAQNDLVACCKYFNITPVAYCPLGSTAEWQKGKPNIRDDPVIRRIAQERNESTSSTLIRWHVQKGWSVLPKSLNPHHIQDNFNAGHSQPLTESQMKEINALDKGGLGRYVPGDIPWNLFC